jgi:hypothetical protein
VTGKYAYGFDLGAAPRAKFEDPDTHEKVDNQLWRAVGCSESFDKTIPPVMPYAEELAWQAMVEAAPAWIVQISGDDLSRDGPVTVMLDTATRHPERDALGKLMSGSTYVIDPSNRSHNVLQGTLHNGTVSIHPQDVYLEGELPFYQEVELRNAHMRMSLQPDGKILGYWGGYQNWRRWIYMFTSRPINAADTIGLFWAIKKLADFDPDPKTGENRSISGTYRMEAVPAYVMSADGKVLARPTYDIPQKVAQLAGGNHEQTK